MILETRYLDDRDPQVIGTDPSEVTIVETVRSLDWNRFAFVTLRRDGANWIDGSGSLEPDTGLSIMLSHDGIEYVTETAPTVDTIAAALCAFRQGDEEELFAMIYHVPGRELTAEMIQTFRQEEVAEQRQRQLESALTEAAELFRNKEYQSFVARLQPFESLLGPTDAKKLELARRKSATDKAP